MSFQTHRVTLEKSNSGHKQMHISKLFSYIYIHKSFVSSIHKTNHFANIKHTLYIHKHQTQIFEELVPSILTPIKTAQ